MIMNLKLIGTILTLLLTINVFSQTIESAEVKTRNPGTHCWDFIKTDKNDSKGNITSPKSEKKVIAIYLITYSENDCHTKEPSLIFREQGISVDQIRSWVKESETDPNYKLNTYNHISEDRPYGVLYSKNCKNGGIKYSLGLYTTLDAAQKRCSELDRSTSSSNYKCRKIISLN